MRVTCTNKAPEAAQQALLVSHILGVQRPLLPSWRIWIQLAHLCAVQTLQRFPIASCNNLHALNASAVRRLGKSSIKDRQRSRKDSVIL